MDNDDGLRRWGGLDGVGGDTVFHEGEDAGVPVFDADPVTEVVDGVGVVGRKLVVAQRLGKVERSGAMAENEAVMLKVAGVGDFFQAIRRA